MLTVVESSDDRRTELPANDRQLAAFNEIRRDLAASDAERPFEVVIREGNVGDQISAVAAETGSSLIVTGTARNELFGRILLGSTVERLSRTSPLPVLTVHNRVHGPYSRIVVASDFSPSSRRALDTAMQFIPDTQPVLFHAFDVPFLGLMDSQRDEVLAQSEVEATNAAKDFLRDAGHASMPVVVAHGDPAARLREYADMHDIDLIVVATHGRSALYRILIGSVAQRVLDLAPCDTLLVPEPEARPH